MNSTDIFTLALGLNDPWEINHVDLKTDESSIKELHLHINCKKGSKFKDKHNKLC